MSAKTESILEQINVLRNAVTELVKGPDSERSEIKEKVQAINETINQLVAELSKNQPDKKNLILG